MKMLNAIFWRMTWETAVTADLLRKKTMKDPVLSKVLRYTQSGWPSTVDDVSF